MTSLTRAKMMDSGAMDESGQASLLGLWDSGILLFSMALASPVVFVRCILFISSCGTEGQI